MTSSDHTFIDVTPKAINSAERLFLPAVFKGLGTTLRHCLGNMGRDGKNKKNIHVVQYPEEKTPQSPLSRLTMGTQKGMVSETPT